MSGSPNPVSYRCKLSAQQNEEQKMAIYYKSRLKIAATEVTWRLPSSPIVEKNMCNFYVVVVAVVVVVVVAVDVDDADDDADDEADDDVDADEGGGEEGEEGGEGHAQRKN